MLELQRLRRLRSRDSSWGQSDGITARNQRRFSSQFLTLSQIFGDSGRDEGCAGSVAGADVAPLPLGNQAGHVVVAHVVCAFGT